MGDSSSKMPSPVIIPARATHTATVIFLHGLGDTGYGWSEAIKRIVMPHVKVICPTAQTMPVTLNGGMQMPSWFDLFTLDPNSQEDAAGIKSASSQVHQLIAAEMNAGISSKRIILGGFSQGGALALYSTFTHKEPLGGVMALSCWLPLRKEFAQGAPGNKDIPVIQCHGDCDPLVPLTFGQMSSALIKAFCPNAQFKSYVGLSHSSSEQEMDDLKKFLSEKIPSSE